MPPSPMTSTQRVPAGDDLARRRSAGRSAGGCLDRGVRAVRSCFRGRQLRRQTRFRVDAPRSLPGSRVRSVRTSPVASPSRKRPAPSSAASSASTRRAELGVAAALAVQVGGTLRRVGEVRRVQEQGFRSCGIDGHGSPPGSGSAPQCPDPGRKVSRGFRIIFPVPRGARPGRTSSSGRRPPGRAPAPSPASSTESPPNRCSCATRAAAASSSPSRVSSSSSDRTRSGSSARRAEPDRAARAGPARRPASAASGPGRG